jgi:hypothetical protein
VELHTDDRPPESLVAAPVDQACYDRARYDRARYDRARYDRARYDRTVADQAGDGQRIRRPDTP